MDHQSIIARGMWRILASRFRDRTVAAVTVMWPAIIVRRSNPVGNLWCGCECWQAQIRVSF